MSLDGNGLLVCVAIPPNWKYLLLFAQFPSTLLVPVRGRVAYWGAAVPRAENIPFDVVTMLQVHTLRNKQNTTGFVAPVMKWPSLLKRQQFLLP